MLRRALLVGVAIFPILVSLGSANTVDDWEKDRFDIIYNEVGKELNYPTNVLLGTDDVPYTLITESAQTASVNVIRKVQHNALDYTYTWDYFVYLTSNDTYLNTVFPLESGRFLDVDDKDPEQVYLSTRSYPDRNQIGVIEEFGGNDLVNVFQFKKYFTLYDSAGYYYIECIRNEYCELFFATLSSKINDLGIYMEPAWLNPEGGSYGGLITQDIPPQVLIYLMLFLILVLIIFCIFNEYKTLGILRLQGRSNFAILSARFIHPFTVVFISSSVVISLLWAIFGKTISEFWPDFVYQLLVCFSLILLTCLLALPFLYFLNIPAAVKGRKGTGPIIIVNSVSKLVIGVFVLILSSNSVGYFMEFLEEEARLKQIAQWTDYGVFYPRSLGTEIFGWSYAPFEQAKTEVLELYPYLESEGALYVDSEDLLTAERSNDFSFDAGKSMTVNSNYLQRYSALGVSGSRIYVDDTETSWVVLVPAAYQDQEDLIRSTYKRRRSGVLLNAEFFEPEDVERLSNQPVKIIWTANDQKYFTFNPQINFVTDPIIQVMTQSNSLGDDRRNAFSSNIDSTLKVYLGDNSAADVLAELEPILSELKLNDNLVSLLSFREYSDYVMNQNDYYLNNWGPRTFILFLVFVMLIIQSAIINYERESRRIAIVKMQGYKFWDCYAKPILRFALTWLVIAAAIVGIYFSPGIHLSLSISRFVDRFAPVAAQYNQLRYDDPTVILGVLAAFILFEALITAVTFKFIESKRVVTTLKGET
jgi:hypothetical protein